jgi:hypothetical protein
VLVADFRYKAVVRLLMWVLIGGIPVCSWSVTVGVTLGSFLFLFKTQLNSIGLSVPHRKHITSPLRTQQINAIYRFVTMVY